MKKNVWQPWHIGRPDSAVNKNDKIGTVHKPNPDPNPNPRISLSVRGESNTILVQNTASGKKKNKV